jgi:hypothetical protein
VRPEIPLPDGLVFADRVQFVLILQLDGSDAVSVTLEVDTSLTLGHIPDLDQAVIPTGNNLALGGTELDHPDTGIVLAYAAALVVLEVSGYFG